MTYYPTDVILEVLRTVERGGRVKRAAHVMSHLRATIAEPSGKERSIDYHLLDALERTYHYLYAPAPITAEEEYNTLFLTPEGKKFLARHRQ